MTDHTPPPASTSRRGLLSMLAGLGACAATGGSFVFRYLLPKPAVAEPQRMYVGQLSELPVGASRLFRAPSGEGYLLTRTVDGVVAFNETCPHLGCKVHWQRDERQFFCPCHGGAFDAEGRPTAGPPKDEDTPLAELELAVVGDAIYALVPV